jgi:chromosome segregation ATPase
MIAKNKALTASNTEFAEKEARLHSEINTLQGKIERIQLQKESFERQVNDLIKGKESADTHLDELTKTKKELMEKYSNAVVSQLFLFH